MGDNQQIRFALSFKMATLLSILPVILADYAQPSHHRAESFHPALGHRRQSSINSHRKVHRREGSPWCEGTCTNLLLCSIQGGDTVQDTSCKGLFSVCCLTKQVESSPPLSPPQLVRVPRQLSTVTGRVPRPGRGRRPKSLPKPPGLPPSKSKVIESTKATVPVIRVTPSPTFSVRIRSTYSPHMESSDSEGFTRHILSSRPGNALYKHLPSDSRNTRYSSPLNNQIHHGPELNPYECGVSQSVAEERILGGQDAGFGQFPWTALIQIKGYQLDKLCAGTLVNNRFILTAGHCVQYCSKGLLPNCSHPIPFSELTFKVVLGEYDVNSKYKESTVQRYYATDVFIHPEFTNIFRLRDNNFLESEPRHDVALLKLDRYVKPSPNIASICLPPQSLYLEPGTLATVTGWGRLGVHEGAPHSSTLQAVTVPVLTREECTEQPGASIPTEDQLCAGLSNSRQSSCPGDSGGGLMIRGEDYRWSIIGIVSTGPSECGLTPVIYHNVISSVGWIQSTMAG